MTSKRDDRNAADSNGQGPPPAIIGAQRWWHSPAFGVVAPAAMVDPLSGGGSITGGQAQLDKSEGNTSNAYKELQNMETRTDESFGQENQDPQHASPAGAPMMPEYLVPTIQLELGQTTAYPYGDPYLAGMVSPYATQALVHPQIFGMPHTRMPLPLEMTEELVYVNAKQYHGILRRRQSRAKAELEKKVIKVRKPYLHESRHRHAMRRARGCGGRFLNTKKADGSAESEVAKGTSPSASLPTQAPSFPSSQTLPFDFSFEPNSLSSKGTCLSRSHPPMEEMDINYILPFNCRPSIQIQVKERRKGFISDSSTVAS